MTDPLSQVIALLRPRTVFSKGISGAGRWAVRYSAFGQPGFCAVLEGSCRLAVDGVRPVVPASRFGSRRFGVAAGSRLAMVKEGVAGSSTKSPCRSTAGRTPSTAKRQLPSSTAQKPGWPKAE